MKWITAIILILVILLLLKQDNIPEVKIEQPIITQNKDTYLEDFIKEVNNTNKNKEFSAIATIYADGHQSKAWIYYSNNINFRMLLHGFLNDNILDIGSNKDIFWFWSKHYDKNTLYWAKNGSKTRLKTPFNPEWIRTSLGHTQIDQDGWEYGKNEEYTKITRKSGKFTQSYLISNKKYKIIGCYVYDLGNNLLVKSEWISSDTLRMVWYEEPHEMTIYFKEFSKLEPNVMYFYPFNRSNKIDMSKM